jgi:hypothetical protein
MCVNEVYLFHTELTVVAGTLRIWMSSEVEECPVDILGCEVAPISRSLLEYLKLRRGFGFNCFLEERWHSQDSD